LRILLAGPPNTVVQYRSWIMEKLTNKVDLLEDPNFLESAITAGKWDLAVLDGIDSDRGIDNLVRMVKMARSSIPVIAICNDNSQEAIEVMRLGVSDYLVKPVAKERLLASIQGVLDVQASPELRRKKSEEKDAAGKDEPPSVPEEIIFDGSSKMGAVSQVVEKILDVDLPILITGESGTGKEILAKYIFDRSNRKGPFIKVNCAAIPSELLESELFGYERGAFTGAYRRKPGKFEAADGGILFLDEISELSYPLQSKLLHVLQDGTIATLGSTRDIRVNVRVIVATNMDLEECVSKGTFRDDLYFRLNVVHINVPPLRERLKQLEFLIDYFRNKFARQYNTTPVNLDDDAKNFLFNYRWPGNIRELENTIRRVTVLGVDNLLGNFNDLTSGQSGLTLNHTPNDGNHSHEVPKHPAEPETPPASTTVHKDSLSGFPPELSLKEIAREAALAAEREAIARVLQQTRWNRKKTAQILSVSYKTLLTKIKETGLDEN